MRRKCGNEPLKPRSRNVGTKFSLRAAIIESFFMCLIPQTCHAAIARVPQNSKSKSKPRFVKEFQVQGKSLQRKAYCVEIVCSWDLLCFFSRGHPLLLKDFETASVFLGLGSRWAEAEMFAHAL